MRTNDLADGRRLLRRQAADVLRNTPQLLVGDDLRVDYVGERGHRRSVEPRPQPAIDVLHRAATVEAPARVEVGGEDRLIPVIGEGRGRRSIAASPLSVTLEAL